MYIFCSPILISDRDKIIRLKAIIIDTVAEIWHKKLKIVRFICLKLRNIASDLTTKAKSGIIPQNYEVYISKTTIKTKKSGPEYPRKEESRAAYSLTVNNGENLFGQQGFTYPTIHLLYF